MATIMLIAIIKETIRRELNGTTFNGILLYRVCISGISVSVSPVRIFGYFLLNPDIFTLTNMIYRNFISISVDIYAICLTQKNI